MFSSIGKRLVVNKKLNEIITFVKCMYAYHSEQHQIEKVNIFLSAANLDMFLY